MKVGLFGSQHNVQNIYKIVGEANSFFDFVDCSGIPYEEIGKYIETAQGEMDAALFTGQRIYRIACQTGTSSIPWVCLRRASVDMVCYVLVKAMLDGRDIHRITYDMSGIGEEQMLDMLCGRIGLDTEKVKVFRYTVGEEEQERFYVDRASEFHAEMLSSGAASVCITGSPSIVKRLEEKGYSAYLMEITEEMVNTALNELRLRHELRVKSERARRSSAVMSVTLHFTDPYENGSRGDQQIHSLYRAEVALRAFAQTIGAAVEKQGDRQFLLYTTKHELEEATGHLAKIMVGNDLLQIPGISLVSIGIGFAGVFDEAKRNALQADGIARKQKNSCYYIQDGTDSPVGPFVIAQNKDKKSYSQIMLERVAAETKVSVAILQKLIKAQKQYGFQAVTAGELSQMCGMTISNMNRILIKLESGGYAEVVGSQSYAGTGRPRRLICLRIGAFDG